MTAGADQATVAEAAAAIREFTSLTPRVGIVLGTGLGKLATDIDVTATVPYNAIPGFPTPTVESHAGRLLFGTLGGKPVAALQGRFHRYEGYTLRQVTLPVRVLRALGAEVLIVSNACGGMHALWARGDLVLLADHINLLGDNPLVGPHDPRDGPRFPDLSCVYDADLRALARDVACDQGLSLREGVYVAVPGPNLETPAEYRMLRAVGADVVGMSTVPEVIVAVQVGLRVLGISIITDQCLPDALAPVALEEILAVAAEAEPRLTTLIRLVVERIA